MSEHIHEPRSSVLSERLNIAYVSRFTFIYNYNIAIHSQLLYCNSSRAVACKPRDHATSRTLHGTMCNVERFLRLKIFSYKQQARVLFERNFGKNEIIQML